MSPTLAHSEITASSDLEEIFLHFEPRFKALPEPKSVVETLITNTDLEALEQWFRVPERWEPAYWCEDTLRLEAAQGATRQEMFGAVFLTWAAGRCRDQARDDAVWPTITEIIKGTRSYSVLFAAGQPTIACKKAIAAGVRRLGLRNVIDRYGKLEYFDTLKLQFGFTYKGAVRRLGEWLDGFAPLPVRILNGEAPEYSDLKSESFKDFWTSLKQFRQHRRAEEYTRLAIQNSPWIRPAWVDNVLEAAAKGKVTSPLRTSSDLQQGPVSHSDERLCEPILRWDRDSSPHLFLRVNEERVSELLSEFNTAEFQIDGRTIGRWIRQEGGDWHGSRELLSSGVGAKPNLRPKILSIKSQDRIIEELELRGFGLNEDLVVFDLVDGTLVDEANRLDPNRSYAVVCDADLSCGGANTTIKIKDGYAHRVDRGWGEKLRVLCAGALYWEPKISERQALVPMPMLMQFPENAFLKINSTSTILIDGIPPDAVSASLSLGGVGYRLVRQGASWQTDRAAKITLGLAVGDERVRVRVQGEQYARSVTPKLNLRLRGMARRDRTDEGEMEWDVVNLNRPLERADGVGQVRIFSDLLESELFEGFALVGRIRPGGLEMRDLHGWGEPLCIAGRGPFVKSVEDHGLFRFLPNLLGRQNAQLVWRSPTPLRTNHQVFAWSDLGREPQRCDVGQIICEGDGVVWKLPRLGEPAAVAVAYEGMRLGSWFHSERALGAIRSSVSARLFATLRWLKIPILNDSWRPAMREAVLKSPADFVRGWLGKEVLPTPLCHRKAEDGIEVAVREFLWKYSDRSRWRVEGLVEALPTMPLREETEDAVTSFKKALTRLADLCPSLAYALARVRISSEFKKHIREAAIDLISRPELVEPREMLALADRTCAGLVGVTQQEIEGAVDAYAKQLEGNGMPTKNQFYLRRLGERASGRRYIAARLLFGLSERGGL